MSFIAQRARYSQCDSTCTTDCGHCKGNGPPNTSDYDDERAERDALRREDEAESARETEQDEYNERDYQMDVTA